MLRYQHRQRLPDDLLRLVAEDLLCSLVPERDRPVLIRSHYAFRGIVDYGAEEPVLLLQLLRDPLPLGEADERECNLLLAAPLIIDHRRGELHIECRVVPPLGGDLPPPPPPPRYLPQYLERLVSVGDELLCRSAHHLSL